MTEFPDLSDEALGRRLAGLPHHRAPAHLRAAILRASEPPVRHGFWFSPALAAAAMALALVLFFVPRLPSSAPVDPARRLVRAVVAEHTRAARWGARRDAVAPTSVPSSLPWLAQETGINLVSVFLGDDHLELLNAEPVFLDQQRGLAVHYRDADGHPVTYIVLPGRTLTVPERERVKIDRFRPALLRDDGSSVWVWKQGDLVCFIVAGAEAADDLARLKDYFMRMRTAMEPVLRAY